MGFVEKSTSSVYCVAPAGIIPDNKSARQIKFVSFKSHKSMCLFTNLSGLDVF